MRSTPLEKSNVMSIISPSLENIYNMNQVAHDINGLFEEIVGSFTISIFFNSSEFEDFDCLFSNSTSFVEKSSYSLYNIPPLLRLLVSKVRLLDTINLATLYEGSPNEVCYIHTWDDQSRVVYLFNFETLGLDEQEQLNSVLSSKSLEIDKIFQKIYYLYSKTRFNNVKA